MSSGGQTQSVTTTPDNAIWNNLYNDALSYVNATPYSPYKGPLVAGQDPFTQASQQYLAAGLGLGNFGLGYTPPELGGPYKAPWSFNFTTPGGGGGPTLPRWPRGDPTTGGTGDPDTEYDPSYDPDFDPDADPFGPERIVSGETGLVNSVAWEDPSFNPSGIQPNLGAAGAWQNAQASLGAANLGTYQPNKITGIPDVTADQLTADQVGAQQVGADSGANFISNYLNPWQQQVTDATMGELNRQFGIQREQGIGSGAASVFGGDRQGIFEAALARDQADVAARTLAQLNSQGFTNAAQLAQSDATRQLTAALSNQGTGLQAALANQGANLRAGGLNQGANLQAALANQGVGFDVQRANQLAGLQGAGLNLSAFNSLNQFGNDAFRNMLGGAGALNQMGLQNQGLTQAMIDADRSQFYEARDYPLQQFGMLQSILTGMPLGMSQNFFQGGNTGAGILGGALSGAGIGSAFGPWGAGIGALGGGILGAFR